ncbi:hypothetical protein ERJ75_001581200 [Trypanosoma vivax]|nr:hypothetical protein ERJ75_001581200 [Trypanosoma vivax]
MDRRYKELYEYKQQKNVWSHSVTILKIIEKDCSVIKGGVRDVNYPNYLKSTHNNILRHLRDIGDSNVTDSLLENGCTKIREHFVELVQKNINKWTYESTKAKVKKMCETLLEGQNKGESCANAKNSFEWILSRFNTTVPKMIMYLNHSLTVLSDAEVKVKNASVTVIEDAREFVCNMSNRMDSINKVFNEYKGHNVDKLATMNISSVVSKLNKSKSLTGVVKSTASVLDVILKTDTTADSADVWIEKARSIHNNVSFTSEKANELNKKGEHIIEMVKGAQSELKRYNDTAQDALQKGSEHIHELVNDFAPVLNLTAEHDKKVFKDINNCLPGVHIASNMTPDKAAEVIERLAHSRLANATEDLSVPLQNCEMEVSSLKNIMAQVDSNCSVAQKVAVEID